MTGMTKIVAKCEGLPKSIVYKGTNRVHVVPSGDAYLGYANDTGRETGDLMFKRFRVKPFDAELRSGPHGSEFEETVKELVLKNAVVEEAGIKLVCVGRVDFELFRVYEAEDGEVPVLRCIARSEKIVSEDAPSYVAVNL